MNICWHRHQGLVIGALAGILSVAGCASAPSKCGSGSNGAAPACTGACTSSTSASKPADTEEEDILRFAQETPGVPQPGQKSFASPEQAAATFKDAAAARDRRTLVSIFGNDGKQLVFSGDRVQEDNDLQACAARMSEYLHIDHPSATTAVLRIGKENWPFPIPIVKAPDGWFFDTVAGRDELLSRRIGEDELNAIAVARAYVSAQNEYASKDRMGDGIIQYAQHFMSSNGKKDGLFWEVKPGEDLSPMGPLVAEARAEGYPARRPTNDKPHPYQGYLFRILTAQGDAAPGGAMNYLVDGRMTKGFAMIASPSKYGASGIMTFIVAKDGKVYDKNLGPGTRDAVKEITTYNPDKTWTEVKD